jgi:putative PIN family toxin of toxin-antitoxin system
VRRVVLDVNVYVSALLALTGSPARILDLWAKGRFEVIVSPLLLAELGRVLHRPKFRSSISMIQIDALLSALTEEGIAAADPEVQVGATPDPGDDYLVALARAAEADVIVSGDTHLTELSELVPPVLTPREFIDTI